MINKPFFSSIVTSIIFLVLIFASNQFAHGHDKSLFKEILVEEIKRHPHSKVEDIYKFIHQAVFGSEHAVKDTLAVQQWMEHEISNLDYSINDELINCLSPNKKIARINLRPYLKKGYDPNILLEAFIKTANNFKRSVKNFNLYKKSAQELANAKKFNFTSREMNIFFDQQSKKGFPAVHHSKEYRLEYKPSYRVVELKYIPFLR